MKVKTKELRILIQQYFFSIRSQAPEDKQLKDKFATSDKENVLRPLQQAREMDVKNMSAVLQTQTCCSDLLNTVLREATCTEMFRAQSVAGRFGNTFGYVHYMQPKSNFADFLKERFNKENIWYMTSQLTSTIIHNVT
jgi:hypothetical protein